MLIKKFRIKSYKSIIDSGDCYLEKDMTIFAGKNESGKSSLLEALRDFNTNVRINEEVIPIGAEEQSLLISITFVVSDMEINSFFKSINSQKKHEGQLEIEISKNYYDIYSVSGEVYKTLEIDDPNNIDDLINKNNEIINSHAALIELSVILKNEEELKEFFPVDIDPENYNPIKEKLKKHQNEILSFDSSNIDSDFDKQEYLNQIDRLLSKIEEVSTIKENREKIWSKFLKLIPNFVLFRSFEDNIPNSVPFKDIEKNSFISDFKLVSNFNTNLILSDNKRSLHKHKDTLNVDLNKHYSSYWTQDNTQLKVEWDSNDFYFWVVEEGELYAPSQRSKGKQWHLSFYLKISARAEEGKVNIILVDEPGLFLHASAQRDIYKRLLDSSKNDNVQVVFTTHSPYLLNPNELHRIRLIEKTNINIGTNVINKVHAKADKETLTPILTAIGLELSQGIQNLNQINNIVVEGPGDIFYLNAFARLINDKDLNFIFGGGSGNMGNVGTILTGWGCKVIYLFDNDQGKQDGSKNLRTNWLVKKDLIFSVTEIVGAIEDVFTKEDFVKYVLEDESIVIDSSISNYIKERARTRENKIDKVLIARQFLAKSNHISLSQVTIERIIKLFSRLKASLTNSSIDNI